MANHRRSEMLAEQREDSSNSQYSLADFRQFAAQKVNTKLKFHGRQGAGQRTAGSGGSAFSLLHELHVTVLHECS